MSIVSTCIPKRSHTGHKQTRENSRYTLSILKKEIS